jgi:hypothetical protein
MTAVSDKWYKSVRQLPVCVRLGIHPILFVVVLKPSLSQRLHSWALDGRFSVTTIDMGIAYNWIVSVRSHTIPRAYLERFATLR